MPDGHEIASQATEAIFKVVFEQTIKMLRRRPFWRRRSLVRKIGTELDDIVRDLRPCFTLGEPTSIQGAFYGTHRTQDEWWRRVHDNINIIGEWFRTWDAAREANGQRRTPEILMAQLNALYKVLLFTGMTGVEVSKSVRQLGPDHTGYIAYKVATDRYDDCLTRYEGLLRRLPHDVGVLDPPIMGQEHFFIRLRP